MKNEGILYVFLDFHSAQLGQKIRCSAEDDLFSASKRVMSENKKSTPIPGQTKTVFRDRSAQQREGHILAIKIVEESAVLSLDFWEEDVIYCGSSFPAGTLACHALNIPTEVVAQMTTICGNLNHFMGTFNSGKGDETLLPQARQSAMQLLKLMSEHKPFSLISSQHFHSMVDKAFTRESVKNANALIQSQRTGKLTDQLSDKYQYGILLTRLLPVLAHLGYSLGEFQKTMLPFAQKLHEAERRLDVTYAEIFNEYFPKEPTFEDAGGWMSMTNATMQYLPVIHPEKDYPVLVKRMHYVSFVGMLRSDFFEGLRNGNAPKCCLNCGRWFLTTDGYLTKYCNGIDPNDPKGRTCRSVAAKRSQADKEDPQNHPIKRIYETRRNAISKCVNRGTMEKAFAEEVMKLAREKRFRAFSDNDYFVNSYEQEMQQDAIVVEAKEQMKQRGSAAHAG